MAGSSGVMVYCTYENKSLSSASKELIGEGARLAILLGEELFAILITEKPDSRMAAELGSLGVRRLYCLEEPVLTYISQKYTVAAEYIVRQVNPSVLLFSATIKERDLAARLAARLGTGLTADCTELDISQEGLLLQTRPAYGGNVTATIICAKSRPQMATVRPGVFPVPKCNHSLPSAEIICFSVPLDLNVPCRILLEEPLPFKEDILVKSMVVVACGRGIRNEEGIRMAERLARALGGVTGASRGAVEDKLMPRSRQVGQTGKIIRPALYIACGISGAIQHLVGMKQAGCVVAINSDPNAPIFNVADYGICGDLFIILPRLVELAESRR